MVVAVARVRFQLEARSLKGKRKVVKSVVERVRSRYNVAISEVGLHDVWQSAEIGICAVGNSEPVVSGVMERIVTFMENNSECAIIDSSLEIIHMGR